MMLESSPIGGSTSNGAVEDAAEGIQGQVRIIRIELDDFLGKTTSAPPSNTWQWLIEFSAGIFNRYKIGSDGVTLTRE